MGNACVSREDLIYKRNNLSILKLILLDKLLLNKKVSLSFVPSLKILHRGERKLWVWFAGVVPVHRAVDSGKKKLLQFFFAGFYFRKAFASLSRAYSGSFSRFRPIKAFCAFFAQLTLESYSCDSIDVDLTTLSLKR